MYEIEVRENSYGISTEILWFSPDEGVTWVVVSETRL